MKHSLLNYLCCTFCKGDLTCITPSTCTTPQDNTIDIDEGLLLCNKCNHWFPIRKSIPELLPDHLRNWEEDLAFLKGWRQKLPEDTFNELLNKSQLFAEQSVLVKDHGSHHKKAEISIKSKVTEEGFFGPGFLSPFNPGNPGFTIQLIRRFGNLLPLLELKQGDVVLDMGAGYAWTTEWLMKMGMVPIGVDICRTYIDIGIQRMGKSLPHIIIADIENLPIKNNSLDRVLCYDAFHHIPDRKKAMEHFNRALKDNGLIVLGEPGRMHELAKVSIDAMDKYGILEKGMELNDISLYCHNLDFLPPEQHFILGIQENEMGKTLSREFIGSHYYVDCNVFRIKKSAGAPGQDSKRRSIMRWLHKLIPSWHKK